LFPNAAFAVTAQTETESAEVEGKAQKESHEERPKADVEHLRGGLSQRGLDATITAARLIERSQRLNGESKAQKEADEERRKAEVAPRLPKEIQPRGDPVNVFISYRHADRNVVETLRDHLGWLENSDRINVFDDTKIRAGDDWDHVIKKELEGSDIIILVVTAKFMRSSYCTNTELEEALKYRSTRGVRVVPVIAEACDWEAMPIRSIAALPKDRENNLKPLNKWGRDRDVALTQIAREIRLTVDEISTQKLRAEQERGSETDQPSHREEPPDDGCELSSAPNVPLEVPTDIPNSTIGTSDSAQGSPATQRVSPVNTSPLSPNRQRDRWLLGIKNYPAVRPHEIPIEVIEIFAKEFRTPTAAKTFIRGVNALRLKLNPEANTERQILILDEEFPLSASNPIDFWSEILILAGGKSRRTLAAFTVSPNAPVAERYGTEAAREFERFKEHLALA
jgi:hypothetical protein